MHCHILFYNGCLSSAISFQWLKDGLRDCEGKLLLYPACSESLQCPSLLKTGFDTKKIAIFIDLGSSYVKVSTSVDREDAPLTINANISSSCWYNGR